MHTMRVPSPTHADLPRPMDPDTELACAARTPSGRPTSAYAIADEVIDVDAAMAEDVSLDVETRKLVLRLYARLAVMCDHEALGVPAGTDRDTLRRAYFDWSKRLHPDAHHGRPLGSYRRRMERIFGRISQAYCALCDGRPNDHVRRPCGTTRLALGRGIPVLRLHGDPAPRSISRSA
ncbi:MAG: J domain-containing protein [Myxococcota bacterium]